MQQQLERLKNEIAKLQERLDNETAHPTGEQFSTAVRALSSDVARVLVNEVLDWRVVLLDRPLSPTP